MNTYDLITQNFDELYHHGIKGQKWGVRRFQNPDGSLTAEGKRRYGSVENFNRLSAAEAKMQKAKRARSEAYSNYNNEYNKAQGFKNSFYGISPNKKHRQAATSQWEKTIIAGQKANKANKDYKTAKKEYKKLEKSVSKLAKVKAKDLSKANAEKGKQKVLDAKAKLEKEKLSFAAEYNKANTYKNAVHAWLGDKEHKDAVTKQWEKVVASGERVNRANQAYKQAKKEYRKSK